jgi:hypothetical protein
VKRVFMNPFWVLIELIQVNFDVNRPKYAA